MGHALEPAGRDGAVERAHGAYGSVRLRCAQTSQMDHLLLNSNFHGELHPLRNMG